MGDLPAAVERGKSGVGKRLVLLLLFAVTIVSGLLIGPGLAIGASASITGLSSPSHPTGAWTSSASPSFTWSHSLNTGMSLVGSYVTAHPGRAYGVEVSGNYAYIADGFAGLRVIDVSNPAAPALRATRGTGNLAWDVAVVGNRAYVADWGTGLNIFDVSNPAAPVLRGTFPTTAHGVAVVGDTAYVAAYDKGLQVIDVSNPAAPVLKSTFATPLYAYEVAAEGTTVYVSDINVGVIVVDCSNPAAPVAAGPWRGPFVESIAISDGRLYLASYNGTQLWIYDVTNPASPVYLGECNTAGWGWDIAVQGDRAYLARAENGLYVVDVSNPATPTVIANYATGYTYDVWVSGNFAYTANSSGGLKILDISTEPSVGYSYSIGTNAAAVPDAIAETSEGTATAAALADGTWHFRVRPVVNGVGGSTVGAEVWVDATKPTVGLSLAPSAVSQGPAQVTLTALDATSGVGSVWYRVNGGAPQLYAGVPFDIDAVGEHQVEAWAVDNAGNVSDHRFIPVTIDRTAPVVQDDAPSGWRNSNTLVTLSAADGSAGVASIDWRRTDPDGSVTIGSAASSTDDLWVTTEGVTTIEYSAIDSAGNRCSTRTATVRIDKGVPTVVVSPSGGIPSGSWIQDPWHDIGLTATDARTMPTVFVSVDGGSYQPRFMSSYTMLFGEGWHVVSYYAVDEAGNATAPQTYTCGLDPYLPTVSLTAPPTGIWSNAPVTVGASGRSTHAPLTGITVEVSGDETREFGPAGGSFVLLADGKFNITARSHNQAVRPYWSGYSSGLPSDPQTAQVWIDATQPLTTAVTEPGWRKDSTEVALVATDPSGADDGSFSGVFLTFYRLGSGPSRVYDTPFTVEEPGETVVSYWSVDHAGNVEDPRSISVFVDDGVPVVADDAPDAWQSEDVTVNITADDEDSAVTSIEYLRTEPDGTTSQVRVASDAVELNVSAEGTTTIEYSAEDSAGSRCSTETATVRIDKGAPSTSAAYSVVWENKPITVSLDAADTLSGVESIWYRIGSGPKTRYEEPIVVESPGQTTVTYWSVDTAGNVEPSKQTDPLLFDAEPPAVTAEAPTGWQASDVPVTIEAADAGSGVSAIDWASVGPDGSRSEGSVPGESHVVTVTAEGVTTISYSARDTAGSRCATETATVRVDKSAPGVAVADAGSLPYTAKFRLTASDTLSGATLRWRFGSEPVRTSASADEIVQYPVPGAHSLTVWAVDGAGNVSGPSTRRFTVTGPTQIALSTKSRTLPKYGSKFTVAGTVASGGGPAAGVTVVLQSSSDGVRFKNTSVSAKTTTGGKFSLGVTPRVKTIYRAQAVPAVGIAGAVSPAVYAKPRARVGTPRTVSRMRAGYGYWVRGSLKSRHKAGTKAVRVYMWRWEKGRWKSYGYKNATVSNYSTYSRYRAVVFPKKPGKWRVRAYHADEGHAKSWSSGYDYMRVY